MSGNLEAMLAKLAKTQPGIRADVEELVWTFLGLPLDEKVFVLRFIRKAAEIAASLNPTPSTSQPARPRHDHAPGNVIQFPGGAA